MTVATAVDEQMLVERLAGGDPDAVITAGMLPPDVGSMVPTMPRGNGGEHLMGMPLREAREHFERAYLKQQLELCEGKVGQLAKRVGMERTHLYRKLRSLVIDFKSVGSDDS